MPLLRDDDIVLFGATGFTGELTARHLASRIPSDARWALAGRNRAKLEAVRDRLAADFPALEDLPLEIADSGDEESLRAVAESTSVVITTVGPYLLYGEGLVKACAEAGTDYVDLTGEPEFVDLMYVKHNATAEASGARLVHCCGFDSIPHDLGALFTVRQLPSDAPLRVRGVVRSNAAFSGGTFHSAMEQLPRARQMRAAMSARRKMEPKPDGRRSRAISGKPGRDSVLGYWL
ncbi:MAG TPA: saccharopine dehydrogenase NADP-binding domain-containing protein, partial [Marmoricola sp.]|nr:saccharopine dehydrogenase NADP-binding domain-containing protein [Marmoricola sp.]